MVEEPKTEKMKNPTIKQAMAIKKIVENRGKTSIGRAMRESGYANKTAKNPKNLTESKTWEDLMEKYLPDKELAKVHYGLLKSMRIEHMVFPTNIKDEEIDELLKSVNCQVRKIQHGDMAIHCWFWSPNDKARNDALDKAYKLKGKYVSDKLDLTSGGEPMGIIFLPRRKKDEDKQLEEPKNG